MKVGELVLGIVDFFAALLPGSMVVLVLMSTRGLTAPAAIAGSGEAVALAFTAVSFLVGAVLNAVGSIVLDKLFEAWPGKAALSALESAVDDAAKRAPVVWKGGSNGRYQILRAYFQLAMPRAFEEVERLEAEQKLFRTLAISALVIAGLTGVQIGVAPALVAGLVSLVSVVRYVDRREKTVRVAFTYFVIGRGLPPSDG